MKCPQKVWLFTYTASKSHVEIISITNPKGTLCIGCIWIISNTYNFKEKREPEIIAKTVLKA